MKATFEEKEYETAANIELMCGPHSNFVRSSGQVLEEIVGYDTAASIGQYHPIWRILKAQRPRGVVLLPAYFPGSTSRASGRLPQTSINLILQYKRPEYLSSPKSRQWSYWNNDYFRFQVTDHQQKALARLERNIGSRALVRYACPAFHASNDLEASQLAGTVLANSGFVSPNRLGVHKIWTYRKPGIAGIPNQSGEPQSFENIEQLIEISQEIALSNSNTLSENNENYLEQMCVGLEESFPDLMNYVDVWIRHLKTEKLELSSEQFETLRNYVFIQSSLRKLNSHWLVVDY
ncbi:hypothetical protein M2116_000119 [Aurantimicrobium minutum]|uniref:hypothetical protein n=1 Tax=Aurantimicrobium minutum TaxID=708131 RepID=UPI002404A2AF|nr:hypothetical protein [Aurantimicrobium minutum]MDF9809185.1 hypothetical protein [Aurantimicrobium minutum]